MPAVRGTPAIEMLSLMAIVLPARRPLGEEDADDVMTVFFVFIVSFSVLTDVEEIACSAKTDAWILSTIFCSHLP